MWLRRIAYDRLKTGTGKTFGVFILSAFWHGFYPGYYFTFTLTALAVYCGRRVINLSLLIYLFYNYVIINF